MDDPNLMPLDILEYTVARNPYIVANQIPSDKQLHFLRLLNRYAMIGGSGGGGKSSALLMAALQFCHGKEFKGYSALIVRRNLTDLKMRGGLMDRALEWLKPFLKQRGKPGLVVWNGNDYKLTFPNGSVIQFGYCDNEGDEKRYHGAEYQLVALDEACQFSERQILFFMSERLRRSRGVYVPLRFRAGTTPGGPGHEFMKKAFVDEDTRSPNYAFIPAGVRDNPGLDAKEYTESLEVLKRSDPLRYKQMLLGDWNAIEGGRFKKEWFGRWRRDPHLRDTVVLETPAGAEVERFRPEQCQPFVTVDPSASASSRADYFCASVFCVTPKANVVWLACRRERLEIPEQVAACKGIYRRYRPQFVAVERVLNQTALFQTLQRCTDPVMVVRPINPMGQDKLARAAGAIALAASGRVFVPDRPGPEFPLDDVLAELISFTGEGKKGTHDDIVDTLSSATNLLSFVRPGWTGANSRPPFRHESRMGADY